MIGKKQIYEEDIFKNHKILQFFELILFHTETFFKHYTQLPRDLLLELKFKFEWCLKITLKHAVTANKQRNILFKMLPKVYEINKDKERCLRHRMMNH